jgi:DNA (cytosine-5)-methyltransferase 1
MRPPILRLALDEMIVDNFAGGGGASTGIFEATGRHPDIAINHDPEALAMHAKNHPQTAHFCEDVWSVDPQEVTRGRKVGLAWFSPDCKHFSRAKGGKPVEKRIRGLAWVAARWAEAVRPRVILLENVREFADWGPLLEDGTPDPARKGLTFRRFTGRLRNLGYTWDVRVLKACDFGAPTTRERLFLVARCDGEPIVWPEPTHGPGRAPYRTAAECIDWDLPVPSIFGRKRELAENTQRRIAAGIVRHVLRGKPFIAPLRGTSSSHTSTHDIDAPLATVSAQGTHHALTAPYAIPLTHQGDARTYSLQEPLRTITGAHRGEKALVAPVLVGVAHGEHKERAGVRAWGLDDQVRTIHASGNNFGLAAATLIETANGEREGQAPRCFDIERPMRTVRASGSQGGLVAAFLAKHNGVGDKMVVGQDAAQPLHTITSRDQKAVVHATLVEAERLGEHAEGAQRVYAFLMKFYSEGGQWASLHDPMHTIPTKDRMALITVVTVKVDGAEYVIVDIGMRMLKPRELFRAQGFPPDYDIELDGLLRQDAQVRMCGNSVCPPQAAALVRAAFGAEEWRMVA